MKKVLKLVSVFMFISSTALFAQSDTSRWGRNSNYNRLYNVKTATEIKGKVIAIEQVVPMKGMSYGMHITVKTESETISVHLGPKWFLDKQLIQFKVDDKVLVKGSKVTLEGKQVVIAREINKNGKVLKLRNENGVPVWAGKGRR
jgi:hypothetical protein